MKNNSLGAVILAAGRGARMGQVTPKAFLLIDHKPVLFYSIDLFAHVDYVSEIVVVVHPEDRRHLEDEILSNLSIQKRIHVAEGGAERQDSSLSGVRATTSPWVAVHDAARPLFTPQILDRVYRAAQEAQAAIPTLLVSDSLRFVSKESLITTDVNRENLHLVQTPQCFERGLLLRSLEQVCAERKYFSDEAGAVLAISGVRARAVPGERANLKITLPEDLEWAEALLKIKSRSA
jgi:2-C-methyl-D-erythritol 4-phosphate cytidylyltransferase